MNDNVEASYAIIGIALVVYAEQRRGEMGELAKA